MSDECRALKIVSEAKLEELRSGVVVNRPRYESAGFEDLEKENGWQVELASVQVDVFALNQLDGKNTGPEAEVKNSILVYSALKGMTPALAREERVWVRLSHVECFAYCRERWLLGLGGEQLDSAVRLHLFARTLTETRDDNAIARLWWNAHIARIADPSDASGALKLLLKTADIRSNFVERTGTAARKPLAQAVARAIRDIPWITSTERAFREFMISLNRNGGGILFEALTPAEADALMRSCASRAQARTAAQDGAGASPS